MRKARSILTLALLGAAGSAFPTACGSEGTTVLDVAPTAQGQVQLSLVGVSSSGTAYRLRQAIIVVQGPSSTTFLDSDVEPDSTSLGATVAVGSYTAFLQEGWVLERISGPSGSQPLSATLLSPNPMAFSVESGASTGVPLRFAVGDETVDVGSFDIVLEVEERAGVASICSSNADCAAGQTCCPGGFLGTCQALAPGAACVLPDLTVDAETARASMFFSFQDFPPGSCALEEGCVDGPGRRRLLSFATETANIGGSDIVLGNPETTPGFEFAACHGHYHFEGYAEYQLLDATGSVAAR
ncbi:MAG TPA: lysyl oxidase family protein, partial [Polyangiaceae bacterium]|nr:lysyl oxidase family protein [Polyangiaceae bacterium]